MINEKEKDLYNTYLAVSRSTRNKPFSIRKNWDGFESSKEYLYIKKIYNFLLQFPQIKPQLYFKAPYMLYEDADFIDLQFFCTQKAISAYSTYLRQLQEESPDSKHHIEFIKDSLRFIGMFCIKKNIPLEAYSTYSEATTYTWMKHVKEHNVSIYVMFNFSDIFNVIRGTPNDELDLLLGSIAVGLAGYKNKYDMSKEARRIVKEGFNRIVPIINKSIRKEAV